MKNEARLPNKFFVELGILMNKFDLEDEEELYGQILRLTAFLNRENSQDSEECSHDCLCAKHLRAEFHDATPTGTADDLYTPPQPEIEELRHEICDKELGVVRSGASNNQIILKINEIIRYPNSLKEE